MDANIADSNLADSNKESESATSNLLAQTFPSNDVTPVVDNSTMQVTRGLIVLFVTALGISVAVDSTISNEEFDSWMIFMHAPRIVYAIFINTLLVYFIIKKDTWHRLGYVSWFCSNNNEHIELDNLVGDGNQRQTETHDVTVPSDESSMLITLYTFGIGSCVFRSLEIASDVHCMLIGFTKSVPLEWVVIVDHFTNLVAVCLQLMFFRMYSKAVFANRVLFHFAISAIVGLQAWWWFGKLVSPLITIYDVDDVDVNCSNTNTRMSFKKCCANHSHFVYVVDEVQFYLKGLYTEYAMVSIGVLANLWPSSQQAQTQNSTLRERENLSNNNPASLDLGRSNGHFEGSGTYQESSFISETAKPVKKIGGNYGSTAVPHSKVTRYTLCEKYSNIIWYFVYLIPCLSLLKLVFSGHYMGQVITKEASEYLQYYSLIPTFVTLPVVMVMTRKRLKPRVGFRKDDLSVVDYVLLITACPIFLISFFRIWASLGFMFTSNSETNEWTLALAIIFAITNIVEAWIQTEFLINIQRFEVEGKSRSFARKVLMYIIIANVLLWLVDSLINEWNSVIFVPIIDGWYGNHSLLIMAVVFPANTLYRFQSAEVAFHAWTRLGKVHKSQ
ncbi:uncharacterized protein LOC117295712 [Asterias rubens]|uniref:uncharacterized protein LOC117295712 n=1 Tax=Asterias rubens TaxID=7604 RepID=UPI0014554A9D|nr:uncharacterized protein LOC117295712 [Asterias rubens]